MQFQKVFLSRKTAEMIRHQSMTTNNEMGGTDDIILQYTITISEACLSTTSFTGLCT